MILESRKAIKALDKKEGIKIMSLMKAAYCAVGAECTIRYLGESVDKDKYLKTVKSIWRDEIENLGEREFVTAELLKWKSDIQVAIGDEEMCSKLLKKYIRNYGFLFTKNIVGEEWAIMGSTFLD
ncbi:Telomeric repeat-binding factor like [Melia azedarach]|uniref:Telomeric repeat-binding factor like n=1 Tax=Melia azedarach TaxID=155640 RepID=A0ACC1XFF5_MELAZ|nr:Telomeric repeat-binding factor like [Melia azedarach]